MNDFDQAARFAVHCDPTGHVRWIFPNLAGHIAYRRWLDSQSAPRPGEPDRRCDTIAELIDTTGASSPRAVVIELYTHADPRATTRTLEYVGRFAGGLRHGPYDRDQYNFSAAMIFLTDAPAVLAMASDLPGGPQTLNFAPEPLIVSEQVAVATLDAFEQNRLGWGVLAWVSLMVGGRTPELIARWRAIVERISDLGIRQILVDVVRVFARLTNSEGEWQRGTDGMLVTESPLMREQRDLGALRERRQALLDNLEARFTVPQDLRANIERFEDRAQLVAWQKLVITIADLDTFRAATGL